MAKQIGTQGKKQKKPQASKKKLTTPAAQSPNSPTANKSATAPKAPNPTDLGNAERLAKRHGDKLRYCWERAQWLVWDGKHWAPDRDGAVLRDAIETIQALGQEAKKRGDPELLKFALKCESRARLSGMVELAQVRPEVSIDVEDLDKNPLLLNCPNGTVNLVTGELQPHRREDFLTKLCPTKYVPEAQCPQWDKFLARTFGDSEELIEYMQRLCGYFITGSVKEQILAIWWGTGANGKSTLNDAMLYVLGPDYGMQARGELLMAKRWDEHPTEFADLFGKRFVSCSETGSGRQLDETRVKQLTGGDRLRARRMRQDFIECAPSWKLALLTNNKPVIRGRDHAIWRRLRLIPFDYRVPENEQDKDLGAKLRAEAEGILAWAVEGAMKWDAWGLGTAAAVEEATQTYRNEEDVIKEFLDEQCKVAQELEIRLNDLYAAYESWCESKRLEPAAQKTFGLEIADCVPDFKKRTSNGTIYQGLALKEQDR